MSLQVLVALTAFLFPLAYSPGPGNMFFALNGARFGLKGIIPSLLGYHVATFVVTLAIGYGAAMSLLASPVVARVLVILSALYLAWIALQCLRSMLDPSPETDVSRQVAQAQPAPSFWAGMMLFLFNPKAYAIIGAMFAAFAARHSNAADIAIITTIFTFNNIIAFVVWAALGKFLLGPLKSRYANGLYAMAFVGVAIWMVMR